MGKRPARWSRRGVLKAGAAGVALTPLASSMVWPSAGDDIYTGKCVVTLQLDGGADVTQLCDPKINIPGEPKINNWADVSEPGQAGNISFAPVADNEWMFNRFGADMLVINGVDAQTNSHETGRLYNWTGSNAVGKPSITALHSAHTAPDGPLAYSVFGGTSRTCGIIGYNLFNEIRSLRTLSQPRLSSRGPQSAPDHLLKRAQTEYDLIDSLANSEIERFLARDKITARQLESLNRFQLARQKRQGLAVLADLLPSDSDIPSRTNFVTAGWKWSSNLKEQMQGALLIFKSGLGSGADISFSGFDSHDDNDEIQEQLYFHLADALGFFWDYATELGIEDRILLIIGSDFGRTNFYNDGNGKDHWPVGSYIIMESNAPWGNRVAGLTDEFHFAKRINSRTLREDPNGILITPAHVHKALQGYLGLDVFADELGLTLEDTRSVAFFDPSVQSVGDSSKLSRRSRWR